LTASIPKIKNTLSNIWSITFLKPLLLRLADEFIASAEFAERLKKDYESYLQSLTTA